MGRILATSLLAACASSGVMTADQDTYMIVKRTAQVGFGPPHGETMSEVEVYYFTGWDQMHGDNLLSKRPATLEAIKARAGTPLPETRRLVDSSELDGNGFLTREIS